MLARKKMELQSEDIVGYQVCTEDRQKVVQRVVDWIRDNRRKSYYFACLNPHAVEVAATDHSFRQSLEAADFLTADGVGVVHASRIMGGKIRRRITGMDVFQGVMSEMNQRESGSCYFLGSSEETLQKIRRKMSETYPNVAIAGTYSPPFKPAFSVDDNKEMIRLINEAAPDVLWVGLTAPKQEKWLHDHKDQLNVNFAGPIGAAFDFFVDNINRAGPFWQDLGLEWLPRLVQEPRRLWRRSLVSAPKFLLRTIRYRLTESDPADDATIS